MAQSPSESDTLPPSSVPDWLSTVLKLVPSVLALLVTLFSRGRVAADSLRSREPRDAPEVNGVKLGQSDAVQTYPEASAPESVIKTDGEWV